MGNNSEVEKVQLCYENFYFKHHLSFSTIAEIKSGIVTDVLFITARKEYGGSDMKIIISMRVNELMTFCRAIDRLIAVVITKNIYKPDSYEKLVESRKAGNEDGSFKKIHFSYDQQNKVYYLNLVSFANESNPELKINFSFVSALELSSFNEILKNLFKESKAALYAHQRVLHFKDEFYGERHE